MIVIQSILLAVWALLLFGGFIFGTADSYRRMPVWTRMWSSVALVASAWLWVVHMPAWYTVLIAIGMSFGLLGDLFMADLIPVPFPSMIGGMGAFGLGHVAYIASCFVFAAEAGLTDAGARWGSWVLWLFIGTVGWYFFVWRGAEAGQQTILHRAALPYALLLASTVGVAMGLALQDGLFVWFAVGAAVFLLSDLLIAVDAFNSKRFYLMGDVIWLTYGPAQAAIVYTSWLLFTS